MRMRHKGPVLLELDQGHVPPMVTSAQSPHAQHWQHPADLTTRRPRRPGLGVLAQSLVPTFQAAWSVTQVSLASVSQCENQGRSRVW